MWAALTAPGGTDQAVVFSYDAADRRTSTADNKTGTVTGSYNAAGWQTADNGTTGSGPTSAATHTAFDASGNVTATSNLLKTGTTKTLANGWRADNQTSAVCETNPCPATPPATGSSTLDYDAAGRQTALNAGNGRYDQYTLDHAGRITNRAVKPSAAGSPDVDWTTTYDEASRPTANTGVPSGTTSGGDVYTYRYDEAGLLSLESYPAASGTNWAAYAYDANGNMVQRTITNGDPSGGGAEGAGLGTGGCDLDNDGYLRRWF